MSDLGNNLFCSRRPIPINQLDKADKLSFKIGADKFAPIHVCAVGCPDLLERLLIMRELAVLPDGGFIVDLLDLMDEIVIEIYVPDDNALLIPLPDLISAAEINDLIEPVMVVAIFKDRKTLPFLMIREAGNQIGHPLDESEDVRLRLMAMPDRIKDDLRSAEIKIQLIFHGGHSQKSMMPSFDLEHVLGILVHLQRNMGCIIREMGWDINRSPLLSDNVDPMRRISLGIGILG